MLDVWRRCSVQPIFQEVSMTFVSIVSFVRAPRSSRAWQLLPVTVALAAGAWALRAQAEEVAVPIANHAMQAQGCHHMMNGERMGAMHKAHLAAIKKQLSLTPEQDAAWGRWVESIKPVDGMRHSEMKMADWTGLTTPQRLDKMQAMHEEHSQRMSQSLARHSEATKTFYAALTEAQQKTFDQMTLQHMVGGSRTH